MLHSRLRRVEENYRHKLMEIINYKIDDPRVSMATVTQVKITKDLSSATVYVSLLEDDAEMAAEAIEALESARGYIKRLLAKRLRLRRLPDPTFILDTSTRSAFELMGILEDIRTENEEESGGDEA